MIKTDSKSIVFYLFWVCFFGVALIVLPHYLGVVIARSQWQMIAIFLFGVSVITLFFVDLKYMIACTMISFLLAASFVPIFMIVFEKVRWVFLFALAFKAISDTILNVNTLRFKAADFSAFIFLTLAFYSQTYSFLPELTFQRSASMLVFYLAVFWGVWNYIQDEDRIPGVIHLFIFISLGLMLLGFAFPEGEKRFAGIFFNPNGVGVLAALMMPLAIWSYAVQKKRLSLLTAALLALGVVFSGSRAGMLSAMVSAGFFLWFYLRRNSHFMLTTLIFISLGIFLFFELFGLSMVENFLRLENISTGSGRTEAWSEIVKLIRLHPWLGYGFGTEDQLFMKFDIVFQEHSGAYAHNSYIGLASQLGIVGTVIFFVPLLSFVMLRVAALVSRKSYDFDSSLQLALTASLLGGLTNAFFESWLYSAGNAFIFIFWSIFIMSYRLRSQRSVSIHESLNDHSVLKDSNG